jgi:hypothetical protein
MLVMLIANLWVQMEFVISLKMYIVGIGILPSAIGLIRSSGGSQWFKSWEALTSSLNNISLPKYYDIQ